MLTIKVLGPGCPNCKKVEAIAKQAAVGMGIEATFIKLVAAQKFLSDCTPPLKRISGSSGQPWKR